jgi:hypothetical protein
MALAGQLGFDEAALLKGELGERAAPDERVAMLDLFDNMLGHGAAADDIAQIFGNLVGGLGSAVGEEENGLLRDGHETIFSGGSLVVD